MQAEFWNITKKHIYTHMQAHPCACIYIQINFNSKGMIQMETAKKDDYDLNLNNCGYKSVWFYDNHVFNT